jgi:HD-GYP domain-containing protein (c-di-GMP phosphodiesterase class II)
VEKLTFSISVGYAVKQCAGEFFGDVFKQAEDDMYHHKLYESAEMRYRAIHHILQTLYEKSPREMQHSVNVGELSKEIAMSLKLVPEIADQANQAGVMHDIGKIGIDQNILEKEIKLDENEFKEIKRHSEVGYRLLNSVNGMAHLAPFVLEHHERWDGTGYPKGLSGESISMIARIIAVADGYDAMVSPRPYKQIMTKDEAMDEICRCAGKQYDPVVAHAFVEGVMGETWRRLH